MTYGEAALANNQTPFDVYLAVMDVVTRCDFEALRPGERIFALASGLDGEVCNGGFDQYFFNGGTAFVYETATALESIGSTRTAQLVRQAIEIMKLPEPVPVDFDYYRAATDERLKRLHELDLQYYFHEYLGDTEVIPHLVDYLREHTDEFF